MIRFRSPVYRPDPEPRAGTEVDRGAPRGPKPPRSAGSWVGEIVSLGRYLSQSEVHTYAFSVAANAILSLFPFIVMMFTVARGVFHSSSMVSGISEMLHYFLPANQDFVVRNMSLLVHARGGVQVFSVTSSGVFLPLEVALNQVWGVTHNRSYVMNQLISLGLAMVVGTLAMISVAFTAAQTRVLTLLFFGHTGNIVFSLLAHSFLQVSAGILSITIFFIIYWVLPNRRLPVNAVLPTAIVVGLLWELAKIVYVRVLVWMDLGAVYGPFAVSVGLMMWAFLTGLLLLAGAHYSASRHTLMLAREAEIAESSVAEAEVAESVES
jgi:YihY family inner membrane protein